MCLRLVIKNTNDYILFMKTAVFVLRFAQCTNKGHGQDADMLHVRYI